MQVFFRSLRFSTILFFILLSYAAAMPGWGQSSPTQVHPDIQVLLDQSKVMLERAQTSEQLHAVMLNYQTIHAKARDYQDKMGEARAIRGMGIVLYNSNKGREAVKTFHDALTLSRQINDRVGEASLEYNIGIVYTSVQEKSFQQPTLALPHLIRSAEIYHALSDHAMEARALMNIGENYSRLNRLTEAIEAYQAVLVTLPLGTELEMAASAQLNLGITWQSLRQFNKSLLAFHEVLRIAASSEAKSDDIKIAETRAQVAMARCHAEMQQWNEAEEAGSSALKLSSSLGSAAEIASAYFILADVYRSIRRTEISEDYYRKARDIYHALSDGRNEAQCVGNLGLLYFDLSQFSEALEKYELAAKLFQDNSDMDNRAGMLLNIGILYLRLGECDHARSYFQDALRIFDKLSNVTGIAMSWINLGETWIASQQPSKAQECLEKAVGTIKNSERQDLLLAATYSLCRAFMQLGDGQRTLSCSERLLTLARQLNNDHYLGGALLLLGTLQCNQGRRAEARPHFQEAIKIGRRSGNADLELEANYGLGVIALAEGNMDIAEKSVQSYLDRLEKRRMLLGITPELKINLMTSAISIYHTYLHILLTQKRGIEAFDWSQKTKARSLIDQMGDSLTRSKGKMSSAERGREEKLRAQLMQLTQHWIAHKTQTNGQKSTLLALDKELYRAEQEHISFQTELSLRHPELMTQRGVKTLTYQEVIANLPEDTAILEYITLSIPRIKNKKPITTLFLFCLAKKHGTTDLVVYQLGDSSNLQQKVHEYRALCQDNGSIDYKAKGLALYRALIAPAEQHLRGKKRMIICPDSFLWELPFHALWSSSPRSSNLSGFIAFRYQVSYAYSTSTAIIAAQHRQKRKKNQTTKSLLVLAASDFAAWNRPAKQDHKTTKPRSTSAAFMRMGLQPLPGTKQEAQMLKHLFPNGAIYSDAAAQEGVFKRDAGEYKLLHFATHGIVNDNVPLMSCLVLMPSAQPSKEDGVLTAREILEMHLPADLAVLSVCNSSNGQFRGGEGLVGLLWALFTAGVQTQLVSQWAVNDTGTSLLMKKFYTELKRGKPEDVALQTAMKSLQQKKGSVFFHPYYWAPFRVVGLNIKAR
jgi:CHAT domain-containing protein/tetratricopeptide (TPR) repeat protein